MYLKPRRKCCNLGRKDSRRAWHVVPEREVKSQWGPPFCQRLSTWNYLSPVSKIVHSTVEPRGSSCSIEEPREPDRDGETAVHFAYTLIQPWSLGLVCKCAAIFRPVSRLYNTFVGSDPLPLDTRGLRCVRVCVRACVRAYLVNALSQLAPIRTRACVATAGPAKPVTHAARRHQHHTGTPTPTPNGGAPFAYRPGQEHTSFLLSLLLRSSRSLSLFLAATTRGYARSNHARSRGYTPIDPCLRKDHLRGISSFRWSMQDFQEERSVLLDTLAWRREFWFDSAVFSFFWGIILTRL